MATSEATPLPSKLINANPDEFTIYDFIKESKLSAEDNAETRFKESKNEHEAHQLTYVSCFDVSPEKVFRPTSPLKERLQYKTSPKFSPSVGLTGRKETNSPKKIGSAVKLASKSPGDESKVGENKENSAGSEKVMTPQSKMKEKRIEGETFAQKSKQETEDFYRLIEQKLQKSGFVKRHSVNGRFDLILGADHGDGIPFTRLAQMFRYDYGIKPHVNYLKDHAIFKRYEIIYEAMKDQAKAGNIDAECMDHVLECVVFPAGDEDVVKDHLNELQGMLEKREKWDKDQNETSIWLLSDLATDKKDSMRLHEAIEIHAAKDIAERIRKSPVTLKVTRMFSNYVSINGKPLMFEYLVLVDHMFNAFILPKPSEFSMDLADSIPIHPEQHEFARECCHVLVKDDALGDLKSVNMQHQLKVVKMTIYGCLKALKNRLYSDEENFTTFQLLGFDFLMTASNEMMLLHITDSPLLHQYNLGEVAEDVFEVGIRPVFSEAIGLTNERRTCFESLEMN